LEGVVAVEVHADLDFARQPFMCKFDVAAFVFPEVFICPFRDFGLGDEVYGVEFGFDFFDDSACFLFEVFAGEFFEVFEFFGVGAEGLVGLGDGHLFEFGG